MPCIPYQGSKNLIARRLMDKMLEIKPNARYFVDLFGGGGAMTSEALSRGLLTSYNELDTGIYQVFKHCITSGIPKDWRRWISREEFKSLKDENTTYAYAMRIVWSFGNKGKDYLFSKEKEVWKKQGHEFLLNPLDNPMPYYEEKLGALRAYQELPSYLNDFPLIKPRLLEFVNLILKMEAIAVGGLLTSPVQDKWLKMSIKELRGIKHREIIDDINSYNPNVPKKKYRNPELKQLEQLQQLQQLEQLERLERLERLQQLERFKIDFSNLSYSDFDLSKYPKDETIIYCDPPYLNTIGYSLDFNFEAFKEWALNLDFCLFVSEYTNYLGFNECFSLEKRKNMNGANKGKALELLLWNGKHGRRLSLFD